MIQPIRRVFVPLFLIPVILIFKIASSSGSDDAILFSKESRVLIVAPHPDDETLSTGGLIQSAVEANADVKVVYLTHGDYNEIASIVFQKKPLLTTADFIKSGQSRKKEAISAMSLLGLGEKNLIFLGYPDLGTLRIWRSHWGETKPFRSFITRINKVPYKEDFSYGQPYRGDNVVLDFEKILVSFQPTHIFVTAPFDLNPDHRAAYLYLQVALLNLDGKIQKPQVFAYLVHTHRWPIPRKYKPEEPLNPPASTQTHEASRWLFYQLKPRQVQLKKEALLKYGSQAAYSKDFMLSFVRTNELYLNVRYEDLNEGQENKKSKPDKVNYWIEEGKLWVDIRVTSPLDELGTMSIEIFSYKNGVDFSTLPKFNFRLLGNQVLVKDGRRYVPGIQYHLGKKVLLIGIPLPLLKSPDYLFVSAQTAQNDISRDFGSWRILKVNKS